MKNGMSLEDLLTEVVRQKSAKKDFAASTKDNMRLVQDKALADGIGLVLLQAGASELERFELSENAHMQIASKLGIASGFYRRFLRDHPDLIVHNVNALFEREPKTRMIRTMDGRVRAFVSDQYKRLDNDQVLEETLPAIVKGGLETTLLSSNVGEDKMHLKVLFTGDELAQEITSRTRTGATRIVRPGFRLSNSETGNGSLMIEGFMYDDYCTNGCVWGKTDMVSFRRTHLGGRMAVDNSFNVISDRSRELEDQAIVSHVKDVMNSMASKECADKMGANLRAAANSGDVQNPVAAVDLAVKELDIRASERDAVLETFISDGDYSKWGLASAVTAVANSDDVSYDRACEIENVGAKILTMELNRWNQLVRAVPLAA